MNISGSGSGNNAEDFNMPSGNGLQVIFVTVAIALTVAAVATTAIALACRTRRKRTKPYYSFTKNIVIHPQISKCTGTDSLGSTAAILDHNRSLERDNMELTQTQESVLQVSPAHGKEQQVKEMESTTLSYPKPLPTIQINEAPVARDPESKLKRVKVETRRLSVPTTYPVLEIEGERRKSEQFAFEDGTPLQDYPASVDLEVSGKYDELEKANIMGYPDIYSSNILLVANENVAHKEMATKRPLRVTQATQETAKANREVDSPRAVEAKKASERKRRVSAPQSTRVIPPPACPDPKEVEEFLNKSMTDLLQMTAAMAKEIGLEDDSETSDWLSSKQEFDRTLRRQGSSLPTLLEPQTQQEPPMAAAPRLRHLTSSKRKLLLPPSNCPSVRASRGSTIDFSDLEDLSPNMRRVIISSDDFSGMQISHV